VTRAISVLLCLGLLAATGAAAGFPRAFQEQAVVQESLCRVHPRARASWLRTRGLDESYHTTFHRLESTGLECIGRWPWGPSWELAGRDTFLYLGSGSGVRILSIADSVRPRMLGQINARGLVSQVVVQDSLLFVACGSWGAQIYSVSDPANPRELGSMDAVISDLCVKDSLCCTTSDDSLRVYSVSDPSSPRQIAVRSDGRDMVVVAGSYAFVADDAGMNVYDVSNPSSPQLVNSRGGSYSTLFVRDTLLFCSDAQPSYFAVLDISDPLAIQQVGYLSGYGGHGLYADDHYAYLSCTYDHQGIFVIDVTNPASPQLRDSLNPEGTENWDPYVPVPQAYGYLASDYGGLVTVDMHNVNAISEAWSGYTADQSIDVVVVDARAYVANNESGLQILDVSEPSAPATMGLYDTVGAPYTYSAVARDSFAFISRTGQPRFYFRVLDVTDPVLPVPVAQETCTNPPLDMVLRDSLCYAAAENRFFVFNVARPREPVLVGSCGLTSYASDLHVDDTVAFMSGLPLTIVSVAQPGSPKILSTWSRGVAGLDVVDTVLYAVGQNAQFWTLSVANPSSPRPLDSITLPSYDGANVIVVGSTAYASENVIRILDVSDPGNLRIVGQASVPYWTPRLVYAEPYLYACCAEGGVCVLERVPPGIEETRNAEGRQDLALLPSVTSGRLTLESLRPHPTGQLTVFDVTGKEVMRAAMPARHGEASGRWPVDLTRLSSGIYVLRLEMEGVTETGKVVINRR
jgi:hypothetical protein